MSRRLWPLALLALALPIARVDARPLPVLRFHVVAQSNSPRDQAVKLMVRDRLLGVLRPELAGARTLPQSMARVRRLVPVLRRDADRVLAGAGVGYRARVRTGAFAFPRKRDGSLVLGAGVYPALVVTLGSGRGQNWWCVLFPPFCLSSGVVATSGDEPPTAPLAMVHPPAPSHPRVVVRWAAAWLLEHLWRFLGHLLPWRQAP